jgi:hypothetical protein
MNGVQLMLPSAAVIQGRLPAAPPEPHGRTVTPRETHAEARRSAAGTAEEEIPSQRSRHPGSHELTPDDEEKRGPPRPSRKATMATAQFSSATRWRRRSFRRVDAEASMGCRDAPTRR